MEAIRAELAALEQWIATPNIDAQLLFLGGVNKIRALDPLVAALPAEQRDEAVALIRAFGIKLLRGDCK